MLIGGCQRCDVGVEVKLLWSAVMELGWNCNGAMSEPSMLHWSSAEAAMKIAGVAMKLCWNHRCCVEALPAPQSSSPDTVDVAVGTALVAAPLRVLRNLSSQGFLSRTLMNTRTHTREENTHTHAWTKEEHRSFAERLSPW
ncbi:hypothetical protein D1007_20861 [Hordeum vulgare]|nr:hypothetical protein D1007_20861 [Hordeum vulgare]